jgi:putative oxidoreductase
MTASAARPQSNIESAPGKARNLILWCVQVLLALAFLAPSSLKLMGAPVMVELFKAVGFGQWLRYLTGILELTGVVLIVVPKTRSIGAVLLATVMLGAIVAHLFILHTVPTMPVVNLLLSSVVVWGRRRELAHFARALTDIK